MVPAPCASLEEKYTILTTLGKGRTGGVYLAEDNLLQRQVAIRRYRGSIAMLRPNFDSSFCAQAQKITAVSHPHLLSVYDLGVDEDGAFSISQYITGKRLSESSRQRQFSEPKAIKVAHQLLEALITLHDAGLTHGSLSPHSITIRNRRSLPRLHCTLMDVEKQLLAPLVEDYQLTPQPVFQSIEQLQGDTPSPETDCHLLGHLLYYILLAGHPWATLEPKELEHHLQHKRLPRLANSRKGISTEFQKWLWKLSSPKADVRFTSAEHALHALMKLEGKQANRSHWVKFSKFQLTLMSTLSVIATLSLTLAFTKPTTPLEHSIIENSAHTPHTIPEAPPPPPIVSSPTASVDFEIQPLYQVASPTQHSRAHSLIDSASPDLLDWAVFTQGSLDDYNAAAGSQIIAPEPLGSISLHTHPVGSLTFFQPNGRQYRPQLFAACCKQGDGYALKLPTPTVSNNYIHYTLHFSCWDCAVELNLLDNSPRVFGEAGKFSSHAVRLSIPTNQLSNRDSLPLQLTCATLTEGALCGISLNALIVEQDVATAQPTAHLTSK